MIHLVVIGPGELARSCMVAGLAGTPEISAEACANPAEHAGPVPDLVLVQDIDERPGVPQLADLLQTAVRCWPTAKIMVLTDGARASPHRFWAAGVRACLPFSADVDEIVSALYLVQSGLIVYPADLLLKSSGTPSARSKVLSVHLRSVGRSVVD